MGSLINYGFRVQLNFSVNRKKMGNFIPTIVFDDDEDENDQEVGEYTRERQLLDIRAQNLKYRRISDAPVESVLEEAALEDLCQEAGCEAEEIGTNGKMDTKEKSKVLERLAQNVQTKKHFQNKQTLKEYLDNKLYGDEKNDQMIVQVNNLCNPEPRCIQNESSGNNLTVDYDKNFGSSNIFNQPINQGSGVMSGIPMKSLHARTSNRSIRQSCQSNTRQTSVRNSSVRQSNFYNRQSSAFHRPTTTSRLTATSRLTTMSGRNVSRMRNISNAAAYSLPENFAYSVDPAENRRMSKILKSNEQTILMAEKIAAPHESTKITCCFS